MVMSDHYKSIISAIFSFFLLFAARPTAPQNLTAAVNHASPVVLNFAEGSPFVGEPVINYTVYCKGIELSHVFNTTTTSLAVNISKLYAGENYTCFVRAVNKISLGPAANISFALLAGRKF